MRYILIFILLTLIGCGVAGKLKRAKKLIVDAKASGAIVTTDTTFSKKKVKGDSGMVNLISRDSVVTSTRDSLVINNKDTTVYHTTHRTIYEKLDTTMVVDGIKVRIAINGRKIGINVKCPDKEIKVATAVNETISCPPPSNTWRTIALVALLLIIILFYLAIKK